MKNNKENNYFYKNRKVLVASILFFIACFIILTVATNTKAEDNVTDFTLPEGAETVDIVIHTEVDDNGNKTPLSNVGIKMVKLESKEDCYIYCTIDKYVQFEEKDGNYSIDSYNEYESKVDQLVPNNEGVLNLTNIPLGAFEIYESELSEKNVKMISPIEIEIKNSDEKNIVSITNSNKNVTISYSNNVVNIVIKHEKGEDSSTLDAPILSCRLAVTYGLIFASESNFKIEKEVYPPTLNDWEANLSVNAYLNDLSGTISNSNLTYNSFLSFEDYCKWYSHESYVNYLSENHEEYYMHYYDEYEKKMKDKYEDEYNEHLKDEEEYYNEYYYDRYDNFEEYCKEHDYSCYSTLEEYVENNHRSEYESYEEYLEKNYESYYLAYNDEFEAYLDKTYKDEYNEYIKDGYETVNLYKKSGNITELNNTESFSTCIEPSEVRRSNGSMYIDVLEAVDENYVVNYSANIPGLKQENNRYYGTIKNAIGHEIVVKATNWDKNYGDLQITKKLFGLNGVEETDKEFTFKVTLTPPEGETLEEKYLYNTSEDSNYKDLVLINEQGNVKSVNVTIKAGGSIRLIGLPAGTTYKVEETDIDGYQVNSQNAEGVIVGATLLDVFFTNTKAKTGLLTVTKKVIDTDLEKDKVRDEDFTFIVTLNDKNINGKYGEMEFKDGVATFTLRDGESKTAINIPENTTYEVTEEAVNGYDVTKEGDKGTIEDGVEKKVLITNTKAIMSPNTSDSILIALILILISLGTVIFFRIRKKELL